MSAHSRHTDTHITLDPSIATQLVTHHRGLTIAIGLLLQSCDNIAALISNVFIQGAPTNPSSQVIVALATLQTSVQDLSRAYIQHANTVLAPGRGGSLDANLTNILSESGLLAGASNAIPRLEPAEEGGKKKRKRMPHDPNAPKRALTPYFLYMQSARTQIAKELGDQAKPKEVADEGTRRWQAMPQVDKSVSYRPSHLI